VDQLAQGSYPYIVIALDHHLALDLLPTSTIPDIFIDRTDHR
jgi:hypothetical protein